MSALAGRRLVFLIDSPRLGGAEHQALLLASQLREHGGAECSFFALRDAPTGEDPVRERCSASGLPLFIAREPIPERWSAWPRGLDGLARQLRELRTEVLLGYWNRPNVAGALVWRAAGARLFVWGQRDEGRDRPPPWLERLALRRTPHFAANSSSSLRFLLGRLALPRVRVSKLPNGFVPAAPLESRESWRERLGLQGDTFAATMIANLHAHKDHSTLLEAWARVVAECAAGGPTPQLLLAGAPGPREIALRRRAAAADLMGSVHFLGRVDDVAGLLGACDLCVHSSRREGLPNAVLEAMGAGLPVVGTDIRAMREVLGPLAEARLAAPGNAASLAKRILELIGMQAPHRQRLGQTSKERAISHFSPERSRLRAERNLARALTQSSPADNTAASLANDMAGYRRIAPLDRLARKLTRRWRDLPRA